MKETRRGTVVRAQSRRFTVQVGDELVETKIPKRLRFLQPEWVDPVAVGDEVEVGKAGEGGVILGILPRRNAVSRNASGRKGKRQLLAANVDRAVVVLSTRDPAWKTTTVDRYLVLASLHRIPALVCINKLDLDPEVAGSPALEVYPRLGHPVFFASAVDGAGVDALERELAGGTCILLGPSGTGKSSLINRLVPGAGLRVGDVSEQTGKGRHTTTWVEMLDLRAGGAVIDSPGIRVLDLSALEAHELARHFPEFAAPARDCRFRDCSHTAEPGCAVKRWVEEGRLEEHRHRSYLRIYQSLEAGRG